MDVLIKWQLTKTNSLVTEISPYYWIDRVDFVYMSARLAKFKKKSAAHYKERNLTVHDRGYVRIVKLSNDSIQVQTYKKKMIHVEKTHL